MKTDKIKIIGLISIVAVVIGAVVYFLYKHGEKIECNCDDCTECDCCNFE